MDKVILSLGIVTLLFGILYLLKPDVMRQLMRFFKQGNRLYVIALVRFALAVVFLVAARECDIAWVIVTFGILFLISGLLIMALGLERVKSILDWWQGQSSVLLRILAVVTVAVGAVIIYSA
jgi:hypothetical protein